MTRLTILALALVLLTVPATAQTTVTRDGMGRELFTSTRDRGGTVVRDWAGREITTTRKPK